MLDVHLQACWSPSSAVLGGSWLTFFLTGVSEMASRFQRHKQHSLSVHDGRAVCRPGHFSARWSEKSPLRMSDVLTGCARTTAQPTFHLHACGSNGSKLCGAWSDAYGAWYGCGLPAAAMTQVSWSELARPWQRSFCEVQRRSKWVSEVPSLELRLALALSEDEHQHGARSCAKGEPEKLAPCRH